MCKIPSSILLHMGTLSLLILLTAEQAMGESMVAVGEASEELWRGDRLPILPFPTEIESKQS